MATELSEVAKATASRVANEIIKRALGARGWDSLIRQEGGSVAFRIRIEPSGVVTGSREIAATDTNGMIDG